MFYQAECAGNEDKESCDANIQCKWDYGVRGYNQNHPASGDPTNGFCGRYQCI